MLCHPFSLAFFSHYCVVTSVPAPPEICFLLVSALLLFASLLVLVY